MDARRTRQARLAEQLRTPRYGRLIEDWRQFLERPTGMDREPPSTLRPVVELASERIASAVERVVARGDAISVDSRPRRFHELRIEAKKLRYQLEFFAALCEPEIMLRLVSALKRLQDILGAFQDHTVQVDIVRACSASWDGADSHSTLAQERLAVVLEQRRATDTQEFMTRWAEFTVGIPSDLTRQLVREP